MNRLLLSAIAVINLCTTRAQQTTNYDLAKMLGDNKLIAQPGRSLKLLDEKNGVSTNSIVWLKDVDFNEAPLTLTCAEKMFF
ncbi:MAG TPA: hypothetical protein VKR53_19965 [Puia sp.]|nr:hypothetical protein [Puia sp.]